MEKKVIIAIVLSILIIISYPLILQKFYPQAQQPLPAQSEKAQIAKEVDIAQIVPEENPKPDDGKNSAIENKQFLLTFSDLRANLKDVILKKSFQANPEKINLVTIDNPDEAIFGLLNSASGQPIIAAAKLLSSSNYDLVYNCNINSDIVLQKSFKISDDNNYIDANLKFMNKSSKDLRFCYRIISTSKIDTKYDIDGRSVEIVSYVNSKLIREPFRKGQKQNIIHIGRADWAGLKNRYFSVILKPEQPGTKVIIHHEQTENPVIAIEVMPFTIPAGGEIAHKYVLYAGLNNMKSLRAVGLEGLISSGFLAPIGEFLVGVMQVFYNFTHNWGVAIILLTILINIVLFPLSYKSYQSMSKLQMLQPEITKLRAQHKGNPQKLNKETMELYKKYKVNPMGGCLPLLLQMPIFIALYQTLLHSSELKYAHFLWVRDLSSPDIALVISGLPVNILPILMTVAMFLQQKLTTAPAQDEAQKQQQKIMLIMPIVFGAIFYGLPSGLVLYWLVHTLINLGYQLWMKKKFAKEAIA